MNNLEERNKKHKNKVQEHISAVVGLEHGRFSILQQLCEYVFKLFDQMSHVTAFIASASFLVN